MMMMAVPMIYVPKVNDSTEARLPSIGVASVRVASLLQPVEMHPLGHVYVLVA